MPAKIPRPGFVYFDLDDTLLDHRKAEKRALADLTTTYADQFSEIATEKIEEIYHAGNVVLWHRYALKEITKEQLRRQRFEHLLAALSIETLDPSEIGAYYMAQYTNYWDYCAGARDAFFRIADKYPVGVLTNGFARVQHAKLAQFAEVRDRLDACIISEEFGHMKPHPRLFEHASRQANTRPEDIVYVGDSMTSDVEGGLNAGWSVIWYAPHGEAASAEFHHARSWADVEEMLTG